MPYANLQRGAFYDLTWTVPPELDDDAAAACARAAARALGLEQLAFSRIIGGDGQARVQSRRDGGLELPWHSAGVELVDVALVASGDTHTDRDQRRHGTRTGRMTRAVLWRVFVRNRCGVAGGSFVETADPLRELQGDAWALRNARIQAAWSLSPVSRGEDGWIAVVLPAGVSPFDSLEGQDCEDLEPRARTGAAAAPALPRIAQGAGPGGLDAGLAPEIATEVVRAWQKETDPDKLRELATTMREGAFPIAAELLDQRASYAEKAELARERDAEKPVKNRGRAIAVTLGVVGAIAAVAAVVKR